MKKIKKILLPLTILVMAGFFLFSCNSKESQNNKIVVGIHSWPGNGPLYVGDEKGFFKDLGIDLQFQRIESFDSRRAALVAKQIDVDCTTLDQLLILWENNFEAQVFGISDFSTGGDGIITKLNIKSLKDLKGKTVAYAEASPSDFFLRYLLKKEGLSINDLKRQPVADAQAAGTTILAEQVDAAVTFEPWLSQSNENKNLHILASTKEYPDLIPGIYNARKEDLVEREDLYKKFMQAWFKSVDYFYQHPEESKEIIIRRMGISKEDLEAILSTITILNKEQSLKNFDKNKLPNIFELTKYISEFWKESGFVTKVYDENKLVFQLFKK